MGWLSKLFNLEVFDEKKPFIGGGNGAEGSQDLKNSGVDARNRLKLVLMHDRSKLSPETLEKMRDELIAVITKYVEIDSEALRLNFETESNTIALVANIPVVRQREDDLPSESTGGAASEKKADTVVSPVAKGQFEKGKAAVAGNTKTKEATSLGTNTATKSDKNKVQPSLV